MKDGPRTARIVTVTCCCVAVRLAADVGSARRRRVDPVDLRLVVAAEAPGGDHERRDEQDRGQRDPHRAGLALRSRPRRCRPIGARGTWRSGAGPPHAADEAEVVLLDVEPAVEPEHVGVDLEEALRVRVPRKLLEPLLLEEPQILRRRLGPRLELLEVEVLTDARFAKARADLEHETGSLVVIRRRRTTQRSPRYVRIP